MISPKLDNFCTKELKKIYGYFALMAYSEE